MSNIMPIAVSAGVPTRSTDSFTPSNETVPMVAKAIMIAKDKPISPIRFITKAFLDAVA